MSISPDQVRNDTNASAALLLRKDNEFEEVAIDILLTSSAAVALVKTTDNRQLPT